MEREDEMQNLAAIPVDDDDDEDSFVVLSTNSINDDSHDSFNTEEIPPIGTHNIQNMQNLIKREISQINSSNAIPEMPTVTDTLNTVATSIANITLSPDSSYEEIQKQVEDLIKENEKLKNIIAQNNISMKTQYERILAWKEEVNEVMKSYKNKFGEAKTYIDKCKEENAKLANDVEKYKKIKELQDEEIMNFKKKEKERDNTNYVSSSAEQNMAQFELQTANEKIKHLETALAETKFDNANISSENNKLSAENKKLSSENEKLVQQLVNSPKLENEMESQEKEINDLKMQIAAHSTNEKSQNDQIIVLKNKIEELKLALEEERNRNQKLLESTNTLTFDNKVQQDKRINQLEEENSELTKKIRYHEQQVTQLNQENIELKNTKSFLSSHVSTLETQLLREKEISEEKYNQISQQLMNSQIIITALEQEDKNKIKQVEELKQLLQTSSKTDEIFALNEQLAVYKNDFEAERESKNAIKRERDQIAEDLQNLQKRNKQLQQEVESLRERDRSESYMCPKCSFGFSTYQSLENHVHRCLDLEEIP